MDVIDLQQKFSLFTDPWRPKIIGELNGQHVKIARIEGPFVFHRHDDADELFLVIRGRFRMELRDRSLELGEGQMLIVPKGIEHRPVADEECWILMVEPAGTLNTGDVRSDRTVEAPEWI